tara:strand:- start:5872 stop:6189 length:318 start_codon:yes stop_codon:yes gene_type:complete
VSAVKIGEFFSKSWRARHATEFVVLGISFFAMREADAPGWALILLLYVGTRYGRLDAAADIGALQTTYQTRLNGIDIEVGRLVKRHDDANFPGGEGPPVGPRKST